MQEYKNDKVIVRYDEKDLYSCGQMRAGIAASL